MTTDQQSPSIAVQSTQQQQTILTQQVQVPGNNDVKTSALMSTEYMVKTSQEGLKMTINKTNNKSTLKKSKSSSTLSSDSTVSLNSAPKRSHTGLKVGVSSGPSSKKNGHINHMFNSSTSSLNSCSSSSGVSSTKTSFHKSNSSGNLLGKLSSNSSKHSDSNSLSPKKMPNSKLDHHVDMLKILQYASPTMAANMEGFMKGLNSKFQIPKLSQRAASSNSNENSSSSTASAITTSDCNNSSNSLSNISPSTTQQSVSLHILKSPMVPTTNTAQMEDTTPLLSTTLNAK